MPSNKIATMSMFALLLALAPLPAAAAPATDQSNIYKNPADYFTYSAKDSAESPWTATFAKSCNAPTGPLHSIKITALSGSEAVISCNKSDAAAFTKASAGLAAAEIKRAAQSRNGFEEGSVLFDSYNMLLALLKQDPDAFNDQAWIAMTKTEIEMAQNTSNLTRAYPWVFPPAELQGRNPAIAAEDLMPRFKAEVLRRAKANPDRFMLMITIANLKYDRATGRLNFGRSTPAGDILVKSPLNMKYDGRTVYGVDRNDGVKPYAAEQLKTAGLRAAATQGAPGLIFDRDILLQGVKLPQDAAERLLNKTQMLTVNVVLSVVDAARDPAQKGLSLRSTNGFLYTRVERVALTDPAGRLLARYDVSKMPESKAVAAAVPLSGAARQAQIFCQSHAKRVAQARKAGNQRLLTYLEQQYQKNDCATLKTP